MLTCIDTLACMDCADVRIPLLHSRCAAGSLRGEAVSAQCCCLTMHMMQPLPESSPSDSAPASPAAAAAGLLRGVKVLALAGEAAVAGVAAASAARVRGPADAIRTAITR